MAKNLPSAITSRASTTGYSGKPLPQKLGLSSGQRIAVLHPPPDWDALIGHLPPDVACFGKAVKDLNLAVLFATERAKLAKEFPTLAGKMAVGGILWISWPKKSAKLATDLDENVVRAVGLDDNWVDVKVCAVSEIWSALKFLRRRAK